MRRIYRIYKEEIISNFDSRLSPTKSSETWLSVLVFYYKYILLEVCMYKQIVLNPVATPWDIYF